jgi:hypothetical protein
MKHRKFVFTSSLVMIGIAAVIAGMALYTNYAVKASVPDLPDTLNHLPSDYQVIFGMNVERFVASPAYERHVEMHGEKIGNDLEVFIEQTGVDPRRDISYLVAAGRAGDQGKGKGVIVVAGRFNQDTITSYIRSKTSPVELQYGGALVMMIPDAKNDAIEKGIAFLSNQEIALGDLDSLKAILDVRADPSKSILNNSNIAPLISNISTNEMFWFAGDAAGILSKAPVTNPLGANVASIRNIFGTLDISDIVSGKITATAADAESAAKLVDVAKGLIALGQLAGDQNPDFVTLLQGLVITQDASKVSVTLNVPLDLLERLGQARELLNQQVPSI